MKLCSLVVLILLICACTQSGYTQLYRPTLDPKTTPNYSPLGPDEEPEVFSTDNFDRDISIFLARHYEVVGSSSFNGPYEDTKNAIRQAKKVGATVVLISAQYTNTLTQTAPLIVPSSQATYHSGTVYSGSSVGGYSGTSTSYAASTVPITTQHQRYDQNAVYLVKFTGKIRFGFAMLELTPEQRSALGRNSGVFLSVVYEETPAFDANVLVGDVLVAIDGQPVKNVDHAMQLLENIPQGTPTTTITVVRGDVENVIVLKL